MRLIDADKLKMTTITRWNGDVDFVVYKEELDNAPTIIAEKQTEPTDGDLISRQAVIDIVEFECGEWKGLAKTIVKEIEQLPSAEKTAECDNNHDCGHCDWTECPLEVERESEETE